MKRLVRCTGTRVFDAKDQDGQPIGVIVHAPDGVYEDNGVQYGPFAQLYDRANDRLCAWPANQLEVVEQVE